MGNGNTRNSVLLLDQPLHPVHPAYTRAQLLLFAVLRMAGDTLSVIRSRADHSGHGPVDEAPARVDRLGRGRGFGRAVAGDAGFAHALGHGGAFESRLMTIGAIAAPLPTARDVNQMELFFQTVL